MDYNQAKEIKRWRCVLGMSFETIAKKYSERYTYNKYFVKDDVNRDYYSPIWGYDLCFHAQLKLNEKRNSENWNFPNFNSCNNVDDGGNIVHHDIFSQ